MTSTLNTSVREGLYSWSPTASFTAHPSEPLLTAAMDSLFLRPVFLGGPFARLADLFTDGESPARACAELSADGLSPTEVARLWDALLDARVIVDPFDHDGRPSTPDEIAAQFRHEQYLTELYLVLTGACNLSCSHCISGSNQSDTVFFRSSMSYDTAARAVELFEQALHPGERNLVVFYGGEPMLRWGLIEQVLSLLSCSPNFGTGPGTVHGKILTNGTLLTEPIAATLAEHQVDVVLSVDGPRMVNLMSRPARAAGRRGLDLDWALGTLERFGVNVSLSITLTQTTLPFVDEVLDWITEEVAVPFVLCIEKQTGQCHHQGAFAATAAERVVTAYDRILRAGCTEGRLSMILDAVRTNTPYVQDCFAQGGQQLVVEPAGVIGVCQGFLPDGSDFVGDINSGDVSLDSIFGQPVMKAWKRRMAVGIEPCRTCSSLGVCGGGCPASASRTTESDTIFSIDAAHCFQSKRLLPWLLWDVLFDPQLHDRLEMPGYVRLGC